VKKPSLYAVQKAVLGVELPNLMVSEFSAREKQRQEQLQLPPLGSLNHKTSIQSFPSGSHVQRSTIVRKSSVWGFAAAAVAILGLLPLLDFVGGNRVGGVFTPKGEIQTRVYFERQGVANLMQSGTILRNNDRVRAEVVSPADAVVFWQVVNGRGTKLIDVEQVFTSRVDIKAGGSAAMTESIKLVGAAESEALLIFVCQLSAGKSKNAEAAEAQMRSFFGKLDRLDGGWLKLRRGEELPPPDCSVYTHTLR